MKRNPFPLLVSVSVISLGTLLFPVVAGAIPDYQSPLIEKIQLAPDYRTSKQKRITEAKTSTDEYPVRHDSVSTASYQCWQDPDNIAPIEYNTRNKPCVDQSDAQQRFSVQFGRRIGSDGEILGEFDGVRVDYRLSDKLKLNGIAGYPVLTTEDVFNFDRQLFGISVSSNQFGRAWDLNGYLVEQQENGLIKGKSTGGVIRYLQPGRSLLAYLDYDINDNSPGTLMASGAWRLPFKTTISATLHRSNRPIPSHQQEFLRQSMTVTEGWNWMLPTDRLAIYSADEFSEVSTLGLGVSHVLSHRINLSGDVAVLEATDDTGAVVTTTTLSEYSYHFNLVGKDLLMLGDRSNLDLRYSVTEAGRSYTAAFDTKYPIKRFWNIMPKLRGDYVRPVLGSQPRWIASPTVKMEFRQTKQSSFKIEAGGEWQSRMEAIANESRSSYFASLGYQAKF